MEFFVLSLAKKKFDKIFTKANATIPKAKNLRASDVILTSCAKKAPYPNNPLTISYDANINPRLAGIDNNKHNSIDLFCMLEAFDKFLVFKYFDKTGNETVPTAIPAIAKLI